MARPREPAVPGLCLALATAAVFASFLPLLCESSCREGCDLALASYYITEGETLYTIAPLFGIDYPGVLPYNNLSNPNFIQTGMRVNIPFGCGCDDNGSLGHAFAYTTKSGDTYFKIARDQYHNLTTADALARANRYPVESVPAGAAINVTVSCFCGDAGISRAYGLFVTYPIRPGDTLETVAAAVGFSNLTLLQEYNQGVNFSSGQGIMFVPTRDPQGSYRPLKARAGLSKGATAGIAIAAVVILGLILCLSIGIYRTRKIKRDAVILPTAPDKSLEHDQGVVSASDKLEFSYEELAKATNGFSVANKIGQGGFGAVYYAELREEKVAIKKMDAQATREFLAELKVLAHVHHLNLVRLIGYCIQGSLFLVYEYIENGNLSQHLRGIAGEEPLPWSIRVQIALDSARGLEYIHEYTVRVYIHRDIKPANILIDKNFHAKVADFGLAKLIEVGSTSLQTRLVGTFGYLPPEYARYGDVSPKTDVYAFGVVLYELISAKEAVIRTNETDVESRGLISLFEDALNQADPRENLRELVDPRLGGNYPIDSVYKMAQLARACTQENPNLRPSMRSIVVALVTLSSTTEDWDVAALYQNQAFVSLMSAKLCRLEEMNRGVTGIEETETPVQFREAAQVVVPYSPRRAFTGIPILREAVGGRLPVPVVEHGAHLKRHHVHRHPVEEVPPDGPLSGDVLVVPDEVQLHPQVAEEPVGAHPAEVGGPFQEVRPHDPHGEVSGPAGPSGSEGVVEGGAVVPLEVVEHVRQLLLHDVEVPAVGPVVPDVVDDQLPRGGQVHVHQGVELFRPGRGGRVREDGGRRSRLRAAAGEEDDKEEEKEGRGELHCSPRSLTSLWPVREMAN